MTVKSLERHPDKIRLATRGSPLALKQADMVRTALMKAAPDMKVEIVEILTSGDWKPEQGENRLLETAGGKGQFAKEIEEALLDGRADAGVHSMKDMETFLPAGLVIEHMLPREDPRDCFVFRKSMGAGSIADLPQGITVGTSSVRRASFLLAGRPDIRVVPLRGNVGTRLEKLERGEQNMDGILLAYAGLKRLGLSERAHLIVGEDEMLPAAGQGAVGIEILASRRDKLSIFGQISCSDTLVCVKAERAALAVLDGSCHTPIGAHATLEGGRMRLRVQVTSNDGTQDFRIEDTRAIDGVPAAEKFGQEVATILKPRIVPGILS